MTNPTDEQLRRAIEEALRKNGMTADKQPRPQPVQPKGKR